MNLSNRKFTISLIFIVVGIIFMVRLFFIQVVDDSWKIKAINASERTITEYPARGLIYDRNGKLLVANTAVYDLMVVPKDLGDIDTLAFCELLQIDTAAFNKKIKKAFEYSL
jgi:penicillin-binding protein 2